MSKTPTQSERADFAAFCRAATLPQLYEVHQREHDAARHAYADIAETEIRIRLARGE